MAILLWLFKREEFTFVRAVPKVVLVVFLKASKTTNKANWNGGLKQGFKTILKIAHPHLPYLFP